jgi:hypothetical protein
MSTLACTTKRAPTASTDGRVGTATAYLTGLRCMPLDPNTPESMREAATDINYRPLFTLIDGVHDIIEGDVLVVAGQDYPIHNVQRYDWRGSEYRLLMVEDRK